MNPSGSQFESAVDAIVTGDLAAFRKVLAANPDLIHARSPRPHRATLLHYVGANGVEDFRQKTPPNAVEIAHLLLDAGAEVDALAEMYGGSTTLGLVATSIHPLRAGVQNQLIDALLQHGADIDHPQGAGNKQSPINGCLANGRIEAAEFLALRGARLDLEAAAGVGQLAPLQQFFEPDRILKSNATEAQLKSGFKWACAYGRLPVVEFLLTVKFDLNEIHRGETALHWAAYGAHPRIVQLLLQHHAHVNIIDQTFQGTPLGWALYSWAEDRPNVNREAHYQVVSDLVTAGATVDPHWLNEKDRGHPIAQKIRSDPRMRTALQGTLEL